jgi:O-antigen/teichoic acid export membrane protein
LSGTTERRFLSSTAAAYGSQLGRTAIRLVADLTLARLILDVDHGLFDMALGLVMIAGAVRDLGVPYQLVRDRGEPYAAALLWVLSSGAALTLALTLGASWTAGYDPRLPDVLRGLSAFVLLEAFSVVPRVFFERRLEVGQVLAPELGRGLVFATVSISLATAGAGVWSFVAGELAGITFYSALLWARAYRRIPWQREPGQIRGLISRSIYLFFVWLGALSIPLAGRYILGLFESVASVAQYTKAQLWGLRLQMVVVPAFLRVLYPALVEYRSQPRRFVGAYHLGTVSILALEVSAAYFLFFNAETVLVDILLGEQWRPAVPLLQVFAFLPLVDPFTRLGGELLKVRQEDRLWLVIVALNLASLLTFGYLLTRDHGAAGMAWANFLLVGNLLMMWRVYAICGGAAFRRLSLDLAFVYLLPLPFYLGVTWLAPEEGWWRFGLSLAAAAAVSLLFLARFLPPAREFFGSPTSGMPGGAPEEAPQAPGETS